MAYVKLRRHIIFLFCQTTFFGKIDVSISGAWHRKRIILPSIFQPFGCTDHRVPRGTVPMWMATRRWCWLPPRATVMYASCYYNRAHEWSWNDVLITGHLEDCGQLKRLLFDEMFEGKVMLCWYTSSARTSRGRKFQRKKTISQRKNLPIECAQGDRPARCPNHFFAVNEPSAVPWWWCDLFWCHEVACGVRWTNVLGCEVTWGELLWLVATWHVMSCHLMCWSCHLLRCDCLCCVMSRDAMRCHVMCAHVKSCHLLCPAMGWNVMSLKRHNSVTTIP